MVAEGEGDGGVQSYGYRLCLTDRPDNRVPFPKPEGYDPVAFELVRRWLGAMGDRIHVNRIFSLSGRQQLALPRRRPDEREAIRLHHLHYTQGLMWFLANDPDIPAHIGEEMRAWGLCGDEFADTGHWPHQLYDAVGMGGYNIDIREVQRTWTPVPRYPLMRSETFNEGYLSVPVPPYQIPCRALLPRWEECDNLLVLVCLSASHVAFASVRMEPQCMLLGHAAGVAAAIAVADGTGSTGSG